MPLIREVRNNITNGKGNTSGGSQIVEEIEQKEKEKKEKGFQVVKNTPVFVVDEIPLSVSLGSKFLQRQDCCKKWTLSEMADYIEEDTKTIYALIIQGRTPIVRRVSDGGQCLWLVRRKDLDIWVQKYKASHER